VPFFFIQNLNFAVTPLTVIEGPNGCGKTTIIECLRYVTTGSLPPTSSNGQSFVHDPKLASRNEVKGQIKLLFRNKQNVKMACVRNLQLTQTKSKMMFKSLDAVMMNYKDVVDPVTGEVTKQKSTTTHKCSDIDNLMSVFLNIPKPVLEHVIFCHQEDVNWPLQEGPKLKEKFDAIFDSARYTKALDDIRKSRKEKASLLKDAKSKLDLVLKDVETVKKLRNEVLKLTEQLQKIEISQNSTTETINELQAMLKALDSELEVSRKAKSALETLKTVVKTGDTSLNVLMKELARLNDSEKVEATRLLHEGKSAIDSMQINSDESISNLQGSISTLTNSLSSNREKMLEAMNRKQSLSSSFTSQQLLFKNYYETQIDLAKLICEYQSLVKSFFSDENWRKVEELSRNNAFPAYFSYSSIENLIWNSKLGSEWLNHVSILVNNQLSRKSTIENEKKKEIDEVQSQVESEQQMFMTLSNQVENINSKIAALEKEKVSIEEEISSTSYSRQVESELNAKYDEMKSNVSLFQSKHSIASLTEEIQVAETELKQREKAYNEASSSMSLVANQLKLYTEVSHVVKSSQAKKKLAFQLFQSNIPLFQSLLDDKYLLDQLSQVITVENEGKFEQQSLVLLRDMSGRVKSIKQATSSKLLMLSKQHESVKQDYTRKSDQVKSLEATYSSHKNSLQSLEMDLLTLNSTLSDSFSKLSPSILSSLQVTPPWSVNKREDFDIMNDSLEDSGPFIASFASSFFTCSETEIDQYINTIKSSALETQKSSAYITAIPISLSQLQDIAHNESQCPLCNSSISSKEASTLFDGNINKLSDLYKHKMMNAEKDNQVLQFLFETLLKNLPKILEFNKLNTSLQVCIKEGSTTYRSMKEAEKNLQLISSQISQNELIDKKISGLLEVSDEISLHCKDAIGEMLIVEQKCRDGGLDLDSMINNTSSSLSISTIEESVKVASHQLDESRKQLQSKREFFNTFCQTEQDMQRSLMNLEVDIQRVQASKLNLEKLRDKLNQVESSLRDFRNQFEHVDTKKQSISVSLSSSKDKLISLKNAATSAIDEVSKVFNLAQIFKSKYEQYHQRLSQYINQIDSSRLNEAISTNISDQMKQLTSTIEESTKFEQETNAQLSSIRKKLEREQLAKSVISLVSRIQNQRDVNKTANEKLATAQVELQEMLKNLSVAGGDPDVVKKEVEAKLLQQTKKQAENAGKSEAIRDQLNQRNRELQSGMFESIEKVASDMQIEVSSLELAIEDLGRYYTSLDSALMSYHQLKIADINAIIRDVWQNTYRGEDIDNIAIRSDVDEESSAPSISTEVKTRSYNYRVVMLKGNTELDMRGRCSAGQKVLASIVIRLALAETFCVKTGILALDEPTTNLDSLNKRGLAKALASLIEMRQQVGNLQLIVITHDDEFVSEISRAMNEGGGRSELGTYYLVEREMVRPGVYHSKIVLQDI
jgi:DNA repair protein RAD50